MSKKSGSRRLRREEARRIAVRAQLLDARRPADLLTVVEHLTFLQLDPTAVVAPSADLVAWSRLGDAYDPAQLQQALEQDRTLFEHRGQDSAVEPILVMVRPMADLGLYLAEMAAWPADWGRRAAEWLAANDAFRQRRPRTAGCVGPAALSRHPRHIRSGMGLVGLDQRPQRHADARVPDVTR